MFFLGDYFPVCPVCSLAYFVLIGLVVLVLVVMLFSFNKSKIVQGEKTRTPVDPWSSSSICDRERERKRESPHSIWIVEKCLWIKINFRLLWLWKNRRMSSGHWNVYAYAFVIQWNSSDSVIHARTHSISISNTSITELFIRNTFFSLLYMPDAFLAMRCVEFTAPFSSKSKYRNLELVTFDKTLLRARSRNKNEWSNVKRDVKMKHGRGRKARTNENQTEENKSYDIN